MDLWRGGTESTEEGVRADNEGAGDKEAGNTGGGWVLRTEAVAERSGQSLSLFEEPEWPLTLNTDVSGTIRPCSPSQILVANVGFVDRLALKANCQMHWQVAFPYFPRFHLHCGQIHHFGPHISHDYWIISKY